MGNHNALANSELHEPLDVSTASDNTVYTADGAGSGNWEPVCQEVIYGVSGGSTATITGLGDYAALYITVPLYRSSTNTDHEVRLRVGNSGGLTTSAVYFSNLWNQNGNRDDFATTEAAIGYHYTSNTDYLFQSINILLLNFNKERNTVGYGSSILTRPQWAAGLPRFVNLYVKEQKAYDRIQLRPGTGTISSGIAQIMGIRG